MDQVTQDHLDQRMIHVDHAWVVGWSIRFWGIFLAGPPSSGVWTSQWLVHGWSIRKNFRGLSFASLSIRKIAFFHSFSFALEPHTPSNQPASFHAMSDDDSNSGGGARRRGSGRHLRLHVGLRHLRLRALPRHLQRSRSAARSYGRSSGDDGGEPGPAMRLRRSARARQPQGQAQDEGGVFFFGYAVRLFKTSSLENLRFIVRFRIDFTSGIKVRNLKSARA